MFHFGSAAQGTSGIFEQISGRKTVSQTIYFLLNQGVGKKCPFLPLSSPVKHLSVYPEGLSQMGYN